MQPHTEEGQNTCHACCTMGLDRSGSCQHHNPSLATQPTGECVGSGLVPTFAGGWMHETAPSAGSISTREGGRLPHLVEADAEEEGAPLGACA